MRSEVNSFEISESFKHIIFLKYFGNSVSQIAQRVSDWDLLHIDSHEYLFIRHGIPVNNNLNPLLCHSVVKIDIMLIVRRA
jgi:hypothetical protein